MSWSRPVTIAQARPPPASRRPSGSPTETPRTRSSSSVVSRVVSSPRLRCQAPPRAGPVWVSRKPQLLTTYPPIESADTTTASPISASGMATQTDQAAASSASRSGCSRSNPPNVLTIWDATPRTPAVITRPVLVSGANRTQAGSKTSGRLLGRQRGVGDVLGRDAEQVGPELAGPGRPGGRRGRCGPRRRRRVVPVPIRTLVSPSSRWMGGAVMSTVRTRSSGVESTCRLSSPRRSSIRPVVIR